MTESALTQTGLFAGDEEVSRLMHNMLTWVRIRQECNYTLDGSACTASICLETTLRLEAAVFPMYSVHHLRQTTGAI